jgi:hypothetical protein
VSQLEDISTKEDTPKKIVFDHERQPLSDIDMNVHKSM